MKLAVKDLLTFLRVYEPEGREPEVTVKLPRDAREVPAVGDTVTLHTGARYWGKPELEVDGEVVAVAVIVKPRWATQRNPRMEASQESLL